jgi:hypothetical protein
MYKTMGDLQIPVMRSVHPNPLPSIIGVSDSNTVRLVNTDNKGNKVVPVEQFKVEKEYFDENTANPNVWGPHFWASLHLSAAYYPLNPSDIVRERMKCRILAIPYEVPCELCRTHASAFIEDSRDRLDQIVSGKHELGKFYVDFHNKVNQRYNKPTWTYEKAYKYYRGLN